MASEAILFITSLNITDKLKMRDQIIRNNQFEIKALLDVEEQYQGIVDESNRIKMDYQEKEAALREVESNFESALQVRFCAKNLLIGL